MTAFQKRIDREVKAEGRRNREYFGRTPKTREPIFSNAQRLARTKAMNDSLDKKFGKDSQRLLGWTSLPRR